MCGFSTKVKIGGKLARYNEFRKFKAFIMVKVKIDVHINLAGTGTNNSGCWVSDEFRSRYTFRFLKVLYHINENQMNTSVDIDWVEIITKLISESEVDYGVVLGFDAVHNKSDGMLNQEMTQLVVPCDWVFKVCKQYDNLLPGPGINPYRKDAIHLLESCINRGAVLIKWLPPAQNIDVSDHNLKEFYQVAAKAKIPLLLHTGGERTFKSLNKS